MEVDSRYTVSPQATLCSPGMRLLVLVLLFTVAFAIRIRHVDDTGFHLTRQYRSALIARSYYLEALPSVPEWRLQIARLNKERLGVREPPVLELAASYLYRFLGNEDLRAPRVLSSIFWLTGGVFLYLLVKRRFSSDAGIVSTAFYLFVPFGIHASRSFQPDSLMVMGLLISLFTITWYYDQRSTRHLIAAAVVAALAISTKFVSLFPILGAFVFMGIYADGLRRFIRSRTYVPFVLISVLPAMLFYSYGVLVSGALREIARLDIMPHIVTRRVFWTGWVEQLDAVVGPQALLVACLGSVLIRDRLARGMVIGLWLGYFAFGVLFSYTVSTHDYWNVKLIPIVAIALAPVALIISTNLDPVWSAWQSRMVIGSVLVVSVFLAMYKTSGVYLVPTDHERMAATAQEIGELVGHSPNSVFVAPYYGQPLLYHGELSGAYWTRSITVGRQYRQSSDRERSVRERLDQLGFTPSHFIIANFHEFDRHHSDLKAFLIDHCNVLAETERYHIYGQCQVRAAANR